MADITTRKYCEVVLGDCDVPYHNCAQEVKEGEKKEDTSERVCKDVGGCWDGAERGGMANRKLLSDEGSWVGEGSVDTQKKRDYKMC